MRFIQLLSIKPLLYLLHFKEGKIEIISDRFGKKLFVFILFLASAVLADNRLRIKKANVLENKTINGFMWNHSMYRNKSALMIFTPKFRYSNKNYTIIIEIWINILN